MEHGHTIRTQHHDCKVPRARFSTPRACLQSSQHARTHWTNGKRTFAIEKQYQVTTESCKPQSTNSKKGKSPDSKGIRAEDIKACDDETREMVRQIFNEIFKRNEFNPEDWKKVTIKMIHKKGDVENVGNYRPISSLPAILYGRLRPLHLHEGAP